MIIWRVGRGQASVTWITASARLSDLRCVSLILCTTERLTIVMDHDGDVINIIEDCGAAAESHFVLMDRDLALPLKPEHLSLISKALEPSLPERHEPRRVLLAQLTRESGNDDAVGLGFAAQPRGKLHC
jgi:hypothetical protein